MRSPTLRIGIGGAGNVGRGLLQLLHIYRERLVEAEFIPQVVGVVDLSGGVFDKQGLDLAPLTNGGEISSVLAAHPQWRAGYAVADLIDSGVLDIYVEATPLNLVDAEPALTHISNALDAGCHVVTANKGPLALAFTDLVSRTGSRANIAPRPLLRYSACVAGGMPVLTVGMRDLAGESIQRFEGVLNGTSHWLLKHMVQGVPYADALRNAQRMGIVENDPILDVSGQDAACKLAIVANSIFRHPCSLSDIKITGIQGIEIDHLREVRRQGGTVLPLARAVRLGKGTLDLEVAPHEVEDTHPLAALRATQMGVVFGCRAIPELVLASDEPSALPASAALLRDIIDIGHMTTGRQGE
jgi:homoserine dehydrogenase